MLQSMRKHPVTLFPIDVFNNKIGYPSFPTPNKLGYPSFPTPNKLGYPSFPTQSIYVYRQKESQTIRCFDAMQCVKASPSARLVTTTNAVSRLRDICSHNDILLKHVIKSTVT